MAATGRRQLKGVYLRENVCILIKISLNFATKVPIYNKSSLAQVIALYQTGHQSLTDLMMTQFITHAYIMHHLA